MNLQKEASILLLLERIQANQYGWQVVDHWAGDRCAIGIASQKDPRLLVYISTYNTPQGYYDYECETPEGNAPDHYRIAETGQAATFPELLRIMKEHLGSGV